MADKSKQSSSTGSAKRALSKPVLTRLSTIRREVEELLKFSDGILDYENICTKLSALEQETAEKHQIIGSKEKAIEALQKEVVKLRTEKGLLKEEFIAGYEKWKGESKRREDEVASLLQEELGLERRKCESTSQQLRQLRAEISKYKKRYDKDQDDIVGLKHDLEIERLTVERITANFDNCKREVEELQSQIGILNFEQSQIESTFSELDGTVHKLAWHCFHQKIPDPCVVNIEAAASSRRILQVPSNTEPALCMRSAIAEAIISQALCKYIFKPFYLSKSTDTELAALVKALDWLSTIQPDRADIVRYQIASVFDVQQETDSISGCAMQFVLERLDAWLTSQNKEYFSRELTTFFGNAIEIWKQLQKGPKPATFQADLDTVGWNFEDHGRPEYDKVALNDRPEPWKSVMDGPIAVLFPQILVGPEICFPGRALFLTQKAVIAARLECSQRAPDSPKADFGRRSDQLTPNMHNRRISTTSTESVSSVRHSSDFSYSKRVKSQSRRNKADSGPSVTGTS